MANQTHNAQTSRSGGAGCFTLIVLIVLTIVAMKAFPPIQPHVQLPAEALPSPEHPIVLYSIPGLGPVYLTNTFITWAIAYIAVLVMGYVVGRRVKQALATGNYVIDGFSGVIVSLLEVIYNLTEATAGKWARKIFPYFATITLLVLVVNWMELLPGIDSIGLLHESEHGYPVKPLLGGALYTLVKPSGDQAHGPGNVTPEGMHGAGHAAEPRYALVPFFRVASTDLNFTLALALVAVTMTQVFGLQAQGAHYLEKFFNFRALVTKPGMGMLDFAVGLLEIVSEISKILSFSFRLFGNIFAGSVLLFVMGTLAPMILFGFYGMELFVGLIQAFVFGMLAMVFMAQATQAHH